MTDEELRKLDAEIAIEVMEAHPLIVQALALGPPRYSSDIAAAWQIVAKITENPLWDFFLAVRPHLATAHFHDGNAVDFEEMDESVPVAICLAALKAVRAGKPQVNA